MIKTVIFDLDGTLANTIGGIASSCNYVLEKRGYSPHSILDYRDMVGNGLALTIFRALPEEVKKDFFDKYPNYQEAIAGGNEGEVDLNESFIGEYIKDLIDFYIEHPLKETSLYKGIYEMLDGLDDRGITWGIHTNKTKSIAVKIADYFFSDRTYLGLSGPDENTERKPGTGGSIQLIGNDYNKDEILYVGDTEVDVKTARNLGIKVACVSWGFRSLEHLKKQKPDYILHQPKDLLEIID